MKNLLTILLFFIFTLPSFTGHSQISLVDSVKIDSLKKTLVTQKEDTNKVNTLIELSSKYFNNNDYSSILRYSREALSLSEKINSQNGRMRSCFNIAVVFLFQNKMDSSFNNCMTALKIAKEIGDKKGIADCYSIMSTVHYKQQNQPEALKNLLLELKIREEIGDKDAIARCLQGIGSTYIDLNNDEEALKYYLASLEISEQTGDKFSIGVVSYCIGDLYQRQGKYKQAIQKDSTALKLLLETGNEDGIASAYRIIGTYYEKQGDLASASGDKTRGTHNYYEAIKNYNEPMRIWRKQDRKGFIAEIDIALGEVYIKLHDQLAAKKYNEEGLQLAIINNDIEVLKNAYLGFSKLDSSNGNFKRAYDNYKMYINYVDSMNSDENARKAESYRMQYEFDKKETAAKLMQLESEKEQERQRISQWRVIASLGALIVAFLLIMFFQWRNSKHRKQANLLLQQQKEKVESTLSELRSTQALLIQSEKMASLGELTAGIAHEIQNPLNFVNNFSEVNDELLKELNTEADKGNIEEVKAIAKDIAFNSEKINHHGKRADAIVKGMLQHSRASSGQKEPTDINALAEEYLRLSYHGLRAKDKSFNANFKTDFDDSIGKVNIVTQDIGRVILNLINNAFYAVDEKKEQIGDGYEPTVSVSTRKANGKVEITVSDNGNGIPQKVLDKIFQPFFTTKPTGQGTGLGLSLSYDIVKAHGGEIKVETKESDGTSFIIHLPVV